MRSGPSMRRPVHASSEAVTLNFVSGLASTPAHLLSCLYPTGCSLLLTELPPVFNIIYVGLQIPSHHSTHARMPRCCGSSGWRCRTLMCPAWQPQTAQGMTATLTQNLRCGERSQKAFAYDPLICSITDRLLSVNHCSTVINQCSLYCSVQREFRQPLGHRGSDTDSIVLLTIGTLHQSVIQHALNAIAGNRWRQTGEAAVKGWA